VTAGVDVLLPHRADDLVMASAGVSASKPPSAAMRGSQAIRAKTSTTAATAIQRSKGRGRFSATHAMPGAIKARPTVNQPLSIAKVRASASAAAEPAACSAAAAATPDRGGLARHGFDDPVICGSSGTRQPQDPSDSSI